ncbi:Gag-Pol polyprotein [Gossypium australe]|uniref:Gag-Pol polyprotein n=1 Tax=Gossypium australe TaxID=47621 RepID=A0A5B6VA03_9ROSI|nr:Gag-Pol polyprotein [Gossypium australe]
MGKSQSFASNKSKKYHDRSTTFTGYSGKERGSQRSNPRSSSPSVTRVPYEKLSMFRCGSLDHFLKDCPERIEKDTDKTSKLSNPTSRGRLPRHPNNASGSRGAIKDSTVKSEARAPAMTYAIRAREDASAPDVITGTFSLLDTDITALIDPSSTHSYICMNLVSIKNLSIESTKFVVKVSNPLSNL